MMKKPSVTQLIGMLDKPNLLRWANRQGLLGIDIDKERARTKALGSSLHEQIERQEFLDPLHAHNYSEFMRDKEVIRCEGKIETEWFTGRYDCRMRWRGEEYLIDYKGGGSLYFETRLQLAAYAMAEPADKYAMVAIPDFYMIEARIGADLERYSAILIALGEIYRAKWEIEHKCAA
jgi:hypothetical protein